MKKHFSISAIETFTVVAQELSFTRAADVLHITPSAVSHRIKLLEQQLGVQLFSRLSKGVRLSLAGETLQQHAMAGMKNIQHGIQQSQFASKKDKLVIAVIPSLCQAWLIPRLADFSQQCAHIELELIVCDQLADFSKAQIDAHIHFGSGDYQGLDAVFLSRERVYPVCHPDFLLGVATPRLSELLKHRQLVHYKAGIEDQPGGVSWADWLQKFEVDKPAELQQIWFSHVSMAVAAAVHGQGIALGWHKIVSQEIAAGKLQKLSDDYLQTAFSYYLVAPTQTRKNPAFVLFSDWLQQQMGAGDTNHPLAAPF